MKNQSWRLTCRGMKLAGIGLVLLLFGRTGHAQIGTSFLVFPDTGDGYVEIPHAPELNPTTAITVEAWLYLVEPAGCVSLVGKNYQTAYWFGICSQHLRFYARGSGSSRDSSATVPLSRWTHVAVSHDGTTQKFYIDGEPAGSFDMGSGPLSTSTSPLNIGSDYSYRYTPRGAVHEVRLWNVARTQAAIETDRFLRLSTPRPGLVAAWPLDTDARDALGVHNGTLKGGAFFSSTLPIGCGHSYWIPTAAHLTGAGGSQWATDLTFFNPDTHAASLKLYLLPRDGDNALVTPVSRSVPAGQALSLPDIVLGAFGNSSLAGAIQICSDQELTITARTYTRDGSKTYGFGSLATRLNAAIPSGSSRRITDIRENSAFRTNLGLTNTSRTTVTVKVKLTLANGTPAGEKTYTLKPWSHIQRNRVVRDFTAADVAGATLIIEPSGGGVIAYAAIVDNSTNDSTYIEALY